MNNEKKIFIKNYLQKAEDTLVDAEINIDNDRLSNAQNRIYYAIFYSVVALGYSYNFVSSKHKQLMGWFNKEFIHNNKIFDPSLFEIYKLAYNNRMLADYTVLSSATKTDILESFNKAKHFVNEISQHINQILSSKPTNENNNN
ncbi:HEPN domain protein [bacterium BMS3Abin03]|nr:HEPN domain protein [bacterium BMS3Abin03]